MGITNIYKALWIQKHISKALVDTNTYPRLEKINTNINGLGDTNKHIQGLVDTNTRILCLDDISKYTRVRDTNTHIKCFGI